MIDSQTIEGYMAAQRIREEIAQAAQSCELISARFHAYAQASVEEQLAIRLAFLENRARLGELSLQLLRLVCSERPERDESRKATRPHHGRGPVISPKTKRPSDRTR